jgi:hypothetical protein
VLRTEKKAGVFPRFGLTNHQSPITSYGYAP